MTRFFGGRTTTTSGPADAKGADGPDEESQQCRSLHGLILSRSWIHADRERRTPRSYARDESTQGPLRSPATPGSIASLRHPAGSDTRRCDLSGLRRLHRGLLAGDRVEPRLRAVSLPRLRPDGRGRLLRVRRALDRRDVLRQRFWLPDRGSLRCGSRLRLRSCAGSTHGDRRGGARAGLRAPDPDPPHRRARGLEDLTSHETRAR